MSSATEQLCAGLDERGVEHVTVMLAGRPITYWGKSEADGRWPYHYWEIGDGQAMFMADPKQTLFTPEQAIAATLGPGTCKPAIYHEKDGWLRVDPGDYEEFWEPACACSECGELIPMRKFCPNCGRKLVDE